MKKYIRCSRDDSNFSYLNKSIWDVIDYATSLQEAHTADKDEIYQVVSNIKNLCWEAQEELKKIDKFYHLSEVI